MIPPSSDTALAFLHAGASLLLLRHKTYDVDVALLPSPARRFAILILAVGRADRLQGSKSRSDGVLILAFASFSSTANTSTTSSAYKTSYMNPRALPRMTTDTMARVEFTGYAVTGAYLSISLLHSIPTLIPIISVAPSRRHEEVVRLQRDQVTVQEVGGDRRRDRDHALRRLWLGRARHHRQLGRHPAPDRHRPRDHRHRRVSRQPCEEWDQGRRPCERGRADCELLRVQVVQDQ
jgi:hypothetical protein